MNDDAKDREIVELLRRGEGMMQTATMLVRPPCHLCGKEQTRHYIDLRYTGVGRYVACIPCANTRYEGDDGPKWVDPDQPGQKATNMQLEPYKMLPSVDDDTGLPVHPFL